MEVLEKREELNEPNLVISRYSGILSYWLADSAFYIAFTASAVADHRDGYIGYYCHIDIT